MAHLNELYLVIRMNEYSLREEVILIFEYSNHSLTSLTVTDLDRWPSDDRDMQGRKGGAAQIGTAAGRPTDPPEAADHARRPATAMDISE